jgi:hypothetical protein
MFSFDSGFNFLNYFFFLIFLALLEFETQGLELATQGTLPLEPNL